MSRLICPNFSEHRASQRQASNPPLPTLGPPPPFRARQSQIQTAPNFDSFVTTVPARLSQTVQTEAIYRCVGDTDNHTMTHTQDPRSPDPPALSPGFRHLDTNGPQTPREMHTLKRGTQTRTQRDPETQEDSGAHTPGAAREPDTQTYREGRRDLDRDTQTRTLHRRTETHSHRPRATEPHTPGAPGTAQARQCLTRLTPPCPQAKVDKEPA